MRYGSKFPALAGLAIALTAGLATPAEASCTTTTAGLSFGTYDAQSPTPDDAGGTITVTCAGEGWLLFPSVSLSTGSSGSYASRQLANGANSLQYNIYTNAARTQVWGDGSGGTSTVTMTVFFGSGSRSIYGRIPFGQMVAAGMYGDLIVVSVDY